MEALMAASHLDPTEVTEDLKAFERRLTEFVTCLGPETGKWRMILAVSTMCTAVGAWDFLTDDSWSQMTWIQLIWNHKFFTLSCINIFILFLLGIHRRVCAPNIILGRVRGVLNDYNMSCDDKGKLILKARPT